MRLERIQFGRGILKVEQRQFFGKNCTSNFFKIKPMRWLLRWYNKVYNTSAQEVDVIFNRGILSSWNIFEVCIKMHNKFSTLFFSDVYCCLNFGFFPTKMSWRAHFKKCVLQLDVLKAKRAIITCDRMFGERHIFPKMQLDWQFSKHWLPRISSDIYLYHNPIKSDYPFLW